MNWPLAWVYPAATSPGGPSEALAARGIRERPHPPSLSCERLLSFGTRYQLDGFLKSHDVYEDYTMEDFELDRDALKQLGF